MNSYFFKMTRAEKNNILDQHKTIYDGFATQYSQPNQQPLYTQDYANDKGGITVNNKGEVMTYTNMNINEDVYSGSMGTPEETFEDQEFMVSVGEQLDMIGDGDDDLEHGTFEDEEPEIFVDDDDDFIQEIEGIDLTKSNDIDMDMIEPIQEQINKTLDMFKRFKNF